MDSSNVGSETIESLDFLTPRVKRETTLPQNKDIPESILHSVRKNILSHDKSFKSGKPITSSTSLIAKKTTETKDVARPSIGSCVSFINPTCIKENDCKLVKEDKLDKPIIKVTVIPKTQHTQTRRLHRRSRYAKRIQRTVSNQESSVKAQKLYLVVAETKKKIYEIKPYESEHSNHIDEKNVVKSITNIKELIKSLDMDNRKKKQKNNHINNNANKFESNDIDDKIVNVFQSCKCPESSKLDVHNVIPRSSRVRIFGRVGLTEDENYVLNCTATVNNKPITSISNSAENYSSHFFGRNSYVQPVDNRVHKDVNIQVNFQNEECVNGKCVTTKNFQSKESQSTQVNFNIPLPNIDIFENKTKDQINQCYCTNNSNSLTSYDEEIKRNKIREYHNPLVIITVYPKQNNFETGKLSKKPVLKDAMHTQLAENVNNKKLNKTEKKQIKNINSNQESPKLSRKPSAVKDNNQIETSNITMTKRNESPNRQSNDISNKFLRNKNSSKHHTKSYVDSKVVCQAQNQLDMNCFLNTKEPINRKVQVKKTFVEDCRKILSPKSDGNNSCDVSKNENPKVKMNEVRDTNYYDMSSNDVTLKNNLRTRKSVKEAASQKYAKDNYDNHKSSKLASKAEPRRKNFSPVRQIYQANDVPDIQNHNKSTLKPRDSIEIFHRRETIHRKKVTAARQSIKKNYRPDNEANIFAPSKHYRGDNCELHNPVERDKQIRELLGIDKATTISQQERRFGNVVGDHNVIEYKEYKKTSNKKIATGVSLYQLRSSLYIDNKNKEEKNNGKVYGYEKNCCKNITGTGKSAGKNSMYQQLVLNRNIQVFLQVERFPKQRPIMLSRKQYNRVKKTIQKTVSRKFRHDNRKCSMISVGELRRRTRPDIPVGYECTKHTQTERSAGCSNTSDEDKEKDGKTTPSTGKSYLEQRNIQTVVLFDSKKAGQNDADNKVTPINPERRTVSSLEIRYTNVAYMKRTTFSSTFVESLSSNSFNQRNNSLYTIFREHRKPPTPNLGTSAFSLLSDEGKSEKKTFENSMSSPDMKAKKPFLRRLMSCLVMQSRVSEKLPKNPTGPRASISVNSSVDSYHVNTSFGAVEMSSSLYDTSGSYYSRHSICPVTTNKMRKGFFSSVRGFLTNRRS